MPVVASASRARPLGLFAATALVVGHTIGVGVFLTPAALIGSLASPALIAGVWILCGAAVLAGALAFGELAARHPSAGGPYVYLREAWGPRIAFLYGWQCLLVMDPGVAAALAAGLGEYVAAAWPGVGESRWVAVAGIWVLALLNLGGVRLSARVLTLLTGIKILALLSVITLAFLAGSGSWSHFSPLAARPASAGPFVEAIAIGMVAAFFSFGGFWEASRVAGEVRDPNRTLPLALGIGVAVITAVYLATTTAFLYLVPFDAASTPTEFTRRAGLALGSSTGPRGLAVVVLVSVAASLAALLMMAPRLYVAMSRDGVLPSGLAPADAASDTSRKGTLLLAGLATLYTSVGTFQQIVAFFFCTALGFVALAVAGLFVLRRRAPRPAAGEEPFLCPGYPLLPASFILLVTAVATVVAAARPAQALGGLAIVSLGIPAYRWLMAREVRPSAIRENTRIER